MLYVSSTFYGEMFLFLFQGYSKDERRMTCCFQFSVRSKLWWCSCSEHYKWSITRLNSCFCWYVGIIFTFAWVVLLVVSLNSELPFRLSVSNLLSDKVFVGFFFFFFAHEQFYISDLSRLCIILLFCMHFLKLYLLEAWFHF